MKFRCKCINLKEHPRCGKDSIWSPAACSCKKGSYLASI